MGSFSTNLGKMYVEKLINGIIAESSYICCFTCNAEEFEEEKVWLEAERTTLGQRIQVATRKGDDVLDSVLLWKDEADKLIQEDTRINQKCFFGLCPHCIWRYRRGKELAKKKEQIKRLMGKKRKFENVQSHPARLPDVERYSSQHYIPFKSRESIERDLLDALKDESKYIIGLLGMGGTGKTTLAKKVGKQLRQSEPFIHVIYTTVSHIPDIKKIQDDIAGALRLKWEDCNESDRPIKLRSRLTNGEKILVILDDVWDQDRDPNLPLDFDAVGIPNRDNHKGCRILITTRNKQVLKKMDCDKLIELELLSEEDAWIMFKRYAGISNSSPQSLIEKGHKIVNECKKLPVAIAVIASSLKGQQHWRHKWDATLKSLKKTVSMHDVADDLVGIYKSLKFSYDYLKDEKAKRLFLLCSVFREDEIISIEILTRLGIGAGLFGEDYGSYDDARNQVILAKNKLLDSCLLLEAGGEGLVTMHDLVRDAAHWIANKEIRAVNLSHKDQKSLVEREKNTKYLLCEGRVMDVFFSRFDGLKLDILIAIFDMDKDHDCVEVPNSLFENIAGLRVLHLNNKWSYRRQLSLSLPQSIQSLTNIRSLLVDGVDLGDISILGNVQSLETIDLVVCSINELPHEITKLEKLRLLKLEDCEIRRNNPFEVIRRCSSLQELYFKDSFNSFCQEITFPKLQRYHVSRYLEWAIMNKSQLKCVAFNEDCNIGFLSEATFKDWMQTAEILCLDGIKGGWRNLIPEIVPIDQGMNDLVELGLRGISHLQCLIDIVDSQAQNVLSKLVVLKLRDMENLEELCNGPLSSDTLKSLEKLHIENCQHLRSLFKGNLNLCNLKTMTLRKCPMLVSLFQLSTSQSLVQLEELYITNCERLENIIIDDSGGNNWGNVFPKLREVSIEDCMQLEYIFGHYAHDHQNHNEIHLHLPALECLILCNLPSLIAICPKKYRTTFPPLTRLGLRKCSQVAIKSIGDFVIHSVSRSLDNKTINGTNKSCDIISPLISRFVDSTTIKKLSENGEHFLALEWLTVCNSKVENIFLHNEINGRRMNLKLQNMELLDLPVMTSLFMGPKNSFSLQNLLNIKIVGCEKLEIMFSTSIVRWLPQLLNLIIEECKELKHIVEDGVENKKMSTILSPRTCFPKLQALAVINCNKLKCVLPASICKRLPKLKVVMIKETEKLEEIFGSEVDQKVEIPNLKVVVFVKLPSLHQAQGIQFRSVENRFVQNCQMSLTSSRTQTTINEICGYDIDFYLRQDLGSLFEQLREDYETQDTSNENQSEETIKDFAAGIEVQASSEHESTSSQIKTKLTLEEEQEFVENVPGLEIGSIATLPTNSEEGLNEQSTGQQCQMNQQHPLGETDTTVKPSQCLKETEDQIIQEGSLSEKTVTTNLSTDLETRNVLPIPLVAPKRKGTKKSVEEGTTSTDVRTITSSTHSETISSSSGPLVTNERKTYSEENGDGQIAILPSISLVNTKPSATKDVDVGDSQETTDQSNASAMEDIDQLIEEDPLLALEKLLTGKVSISSKPRKPVAQSETEVQSCSVGILLQQLKTLMDSSSDPDDLVSCKESKLKLISLFQQLNQHQDQELLSSDIKDFVEKVQNFFSDHFVKHTTSQQVLNKHNQLLDSKTDLMNKLLSAKSTQTQIDNATSTANTQMHELSLQIDDLRKQLSDLENQRDDLRSVVNNCDVQKKKLKAECTQWAQQSKELLSAIASSEIKVREAERVRNLAKEGFANLKSSFPTF